MKQFQTIDLTPLMNHKFVYEKVPENGDDSGLDGTYILKEDFKFCREERINGTDFCFHYGGSDNVLCEGQRVQINSSAKKIHVIGFAYWEDICEYLRLIGIDGKEILVRIGLPDLTHAADSHVFYREQYKQYDISTAKILLSSGRVKQLIYFHHCVCDVQNGGIIREIVLPDNMFMHIFAITLERESEDID